MPSTPEKSQDHSTSQQASLRASITALESQSAQLEAQIAEMRAKLKNDPSETVKRHIRLLHEYNEIKDIGQGLMGLIADARGVRQVDVQKEFGVGVKD
ncbi:Swi5-domain-containing protein [Aspergillus falconensis]